MDDKVIVVYSKEGKTTEDAFNLLKENGFEVSAEYPFHAFATEEASFRIDNVALSQEELDVLYKSPAEVQQEFVDSVRSRYVTEDILDYDYMDRILSEEYNNIVNNN